MSELIIAFKVTTARRKRLWVSQAYIKFISAILSLFLLFLFAVHLKNKDNGKSVFKALFIVFFNALRGIISVIEIGKIIFSDAIIITEGGRRYV